jgi:hypothetical protein
MFTMLLHADRHCLCHNAIYCLNYDYSYVHGAIDFVYLEANKVSDEWILAYMCTIRSRIVESLAELLAVVSLSFESSCECGKPRRQQTFPQC